jgi:hypothetical protein
LINLPFAGRDREAVQAAPPASRMCTGGAQKRWKINTIGATHESARQRPMKLFLNIVGHCPDHD